MENIILQLVALAFVGAVWAGHDRDSHTRLNGIGGFFKGIGNAVKGVAKGIGKVAGKLAPVATFIPGVGPVASAAMAAAGALANGGGGGGGMPGGGGGFAGDPAMAATQAYLQKQAMEQSQADSQRARELTDQSMDWASQERQRAIDEWNMGGNMRDAFRQQAMQFHDPTNPFSQGPIQMASPSPQAGPPAPQMMPQADAGASGGLVSSQEARARHMPEGARPAQGSPNPTTFASAQLDSPVFSGFQSMLGGGGPQGIDASTDFRSAQLDSPVFSKFQSMFGGGPPKMEPPAPMMSPEARDAALRAGATAGPMAMNRERLAAQTPDAPVGVVGMGGGGLQEMVQMASSSPAFNRALMGRQV